ncbi:hypothetical protein J4219_00010 [Candidatus Woesearchaeota archaeon]|nr:hypothetical protein [Candidatus Woesearchaeota archaeon]
MKQGIPTDEEILAGLNPEQIKTLELKVLDLFMERAIERGKEVVIITDKQQYNELFLNGTVFDQETFILYKNEQDRVDLRPAAERLLDTPEGLAYAKITRLSRA